MTTTGRGGDTAGDVAKPWDLAEEDLPRRVQTPEWIAENLAANNWDVVRKFHLVPTRKNEFYMASWRALWRTLAFDPRLRDQTLTGCAATSRSPSPPSEGARRCRTRRQGFHP